MLVLMKCKSKCGSQTPGVLQGPSTSDDVLEDEYRSEPSSDDESDCCEGGFPYTIGVPIDGSSRMEYNDVELRQLKAIHVEISSVPNFMDISMVDQAICDTGLSLLADEYCWYLLTRHLFWTVTY
jgi:hypothetical protein